MKDERTALYDVIRKGAERLSHKEIHAIIDALLASPAVVLNAMGMMETNIFDIDYDVLWGTPSKGRK